MLLAHCPLTDQVAALVRCGATIDQAAARLGLHRSSVYRRLRAAGVSAAGSWRPTTDEERAKILALIEADHSRREVAALVGRGLGTVARIALSAHGEASGRLRSPRRCPDCRHVINVWPCVACQARAVRSPLAS